MMISTRKQRKVQFPVLLASGSVPREYFLVGEKIPFGKITKTMQLPSALLAAYYVFNMPYPDTLKQFYLLLESCLIGNSSDRPSMATKSLFPTLTHM